MGRRERSEVRTGSQVLPVGRIDIVQPIIGAFTGRDCSRPLAIAIDIGVGVCMSTGRVCRGRTVFGLLLLLTGLYGFDALFQSAIVDIGSFPFRGLRSKVNGLYLISSKLSSRFETQ
jgi:hypothetical protein